MKITSYVNKKLDFK